MKVAGLVRKADMIIWDEAPMMYHRAFEVVDPTVHDLMQLDDAQATEKIFGGKIVVLGGDFRQIFACCSQGGTRRHCQCFLASIASMAACYNSSSSYQHASHGNQF
jgi:ATP-dependent DNA helicase PIF1